jgi:hypothetical protein
MEAHAVVQEKSFAASREQFEHVIARLGSAEARAANHRELEDLLEAEGRELMRMLYQDHLDVRGTGAVESVVESADGVALTHGRLMERGLMTVFGPVRVRRMGYGMRGAASLHPLDAELNLPPESYSHGVGRRIAVEAAKGSFDEAALTMKTTTGAPVPKRQVEQLVTRAAVDFDAFYREREAASRAEAQQSGPILVLSADGKGVVMRKEDLRPATRKAAAKRRHKMEKRLSKGEKQNAKRMATVAAVYTVQPFARTAADIVGDLAAVSSTSKPKRPRPEQKRVWASLEKEPDAVIGDAFAEGLRRDPAKSKRWVALVDGNKTQIRILRALAKQHGVALTITVDVIHVLEYLWKAATGFCAEGATEREAWVNERFLAVLSGRSSQVAAGIRRSATLRNLSAKARVAADKCADYLLGYRAFLHYDEYLADGLPIATGVIEGACRHVVKDRMDLTGARWSLEGAEAVLRLRSLRASGDFADYWLFHEKHEYLLNHAFSYARGRPPKTLRPTPPKPAGRAHLRVVPRA